MPDLDASFPDASFPDPPFPGSASSYPAFTGPDRTGADGAGMAVLVEALAREAGAQIEGGTWQLSPEDEALAGTTAAGLAQAVGEPARQQELPVIERLERLREALACLAIAIARTHGRLAWFLAQGSTVLVPVLRWRALTADPQQCFGTRVPSPAELGDAEEAVRGLGAALTRAVPAPGDPSGVGAEPAG